MWGMLKHSFQLRVERSPNSHSVSLRLDRRAHSQSRLSTPVCRTLSIRHPHSRRAKIPKRVDSGSSPGTRCEGRAWQIRPQPLSQWIVRLNRTMATCFCMAADGRVQSGKHGLSPADLDHPTHSVSLRLDRRAHSQSRLPTPVCRALGIHHTPPHPPCQNTKASRPRIKSGDTVWRQGLADQTPAVVSMDCPVKPDNGDLFLHGS